MNNTIVLVLFIIIPFVIGALTVFFSKIEKVKEQDSGYCIFAPWIPILILLCILIAWERNLYSAILLF